MNHDPLEQLGAEVRQREREKRVEALLEEAAQGAEREPIEAELGLVAGELQALLEPPPEPTRARWLELAGQQLGAPRSANDSGGSARVLRLEPKPRSQPQPQPKPKLAAAGRQTARYLAAALALAAGVVLWFSTSRLTPEPAALAMYQAEVLGATARYRGRGQPPSQAAPLVVTAGRPLTLLLRPAEPVSGEVGVRIWLVSEKGAQMLDPTVELSESGTLRARIALGVLPPGAKLRIEVSRPGAAPSPRAGAESAALGPGWQRLEVPLRSAAPAAP